MPSPTLTMPSTHEALCIAPAPPCGYGLFVSRHQRMSISAVGCCHGARQCSQPAQPEAMRPLKKGQRLGEYTGEARRYDLWCQEIEATCESATVRMEFSGVLNAHAVPIDLYNIIIGYNQHIDCTHSHTMDLYII